MRVHKGPTQTTAPKPAPAAPSPAAATARAPRADAFVTEALPAGVANVLVAAAHVGRSDGPEGREAVLNPRERARVSSLLAHLPAPVVKRLEALTYGLSVVGASLVLRAAAARSGQLAEGGAPLRTLEAFAHRVAGMTDAQLQRRATSLDLDSRVNSSTVDLMPLWHRRGVVRPAVQDSDTADNDGLAQRFTAACGTTVLQMMLAEADPVFAFSLHDKGLHADATAGPIAAFQADLLNQMGGVAIGRVEATLRSRLHNALGRLESGGTITATAKRALTAHAFKDGPLTAPAQRALTACRQAYAGFPSEAELKRLRARPLPDKDAGLGVTEFLSLIHRMCTPMTGVTYEATRPESGFARGGAARHFDAVEAALKRGVDVPFGTSEPAHWMLLTAVDGRQPHRRFLVSDPDGGRTAWVLEKDLANGSFADKQFHLNQKKERPYVDMFLLPA